MQMHTIDAAAVTALLSGLRAAFPDLRFELGELLTEGNLAHGRAAVRAQMRGTLQGMWRGVQGAGQTVDVTYMMFITVIDGKMAEIWNLGDIATLAQQLSVGR